MNRNVDVFLAARAAAQDRGDLSMVRAMNAELVRLGYVDVRVPGRATLETTQAPRLEDATVVPRRRGRPPGSKSK